MPRLLNYVVAIYLTLVGGHEKAFILPLTCGRWTGRRQSGRRRGKASAALSTHIWMVAEPLA